MGGGTVPLILLEAYEGEKVRASLTSRVSSEWFNLYRQGCYNGGARWTPSAKANLAPLNQAAALKDGLERLGFRIQVGPGLAQALSKAAVGLRGAGEALNARLSVAQAALQARGADLAAYQREGASWISPTDRALLGDQQGLGKTLQLLCAAPAGPVMVGCPSVAKGVWEREAAAFRPDLQRTILEGKGSAIWPRCGELVALNYELLPPTIAELEAAREVGEPMEGDEAAEAFWGSVPDNTTLIFDECFPPGVIVETQSGPRTIGEIVEGKSKTLVLSCNAKSQVLEYKSVVRFLKQPRLGPLVRVIHESGSFLCTPSHKVWTKEKSYVQAMALSHGDILRVVPSPVSDKMARPLDLSFLQQAVRGEVEGVFAGSEGIVPRKDNESSSRETRYKRRLGIEAHEEAKPDEAVECSPENAGDSPGTNFPCPRRERTADAPANILGEPIRLAHGACYQNLCGCRLLRVDSALLQSGRGKPIHPPGNRGGWQESHAEEVAFSRQAKDFYPKFSRVVRVEILERGNNRRSRRSGGENQFVYNLEVADNHNYFANGVLVSNCHYLKSNKTHRTARARAMVKAVLRRGGRVWGATGTPLLNRQLELWNLLTTLQLHKEAFGDFLKFAELFGALKNRWGQYVWPNPKENISPEIANRLKRVMLRRLRKDVLPQLPEKIRQDVPVEINASSRRMLDKVMVDLAAKGITIEDAIAAAELGRMSDPDFVELSRANEELARALIPATLEIAESYEDAGEPLIVWSDHRAPVQAFRGRPGWGTIEGGMSGAEKTAVENAFQAGKLKGIACSIKAGGTAITLTRAANELFVDLSYVPGENDQAEDRAVRHGQTRGVVCRRLVPDHVLCRRKHEIITGKMQLIGGTIDAAAILTPKPKVDVEAIEKMAQGGA